MHGRHSQTSKRCSTLLKIRGWNSARGGIPRGPFIQRHDRHAVDCSYRAEMGLFDSGFNLVKRFPLQEEGKWRVALMCFFLCSQADMFWPFKIQCVKLGLVKYFYIGESFL